MGTADSFGEYVYSMRHDERERYMMGLAKWRMGGRSMTYKAIANILGGYSPSSVSKYLKPYEARYRELCRANHAHLEQILTRVDPDYAYMVDKRTVLQETCALHMGGDEIINTLKQLAGETNELA